MANAQTDNVFISRTDSGFPAYLDFNTLRTDAINYLGPITSKYWTDYNVHDPGITTLEALLYALMDLGYRTNLPIADLLTRGESNTGKDPNFFTAAEILGCQPMTITDYRKLLIDIDEVRNAWLEVDRSHPVRGGGAMGGGAGAGDVNPYLNGLYKIYIELELDLPDFGTQAEWEAYRAGVRRKVEKLLNAHRNLCEDFPHIHFLKKSYIGVKADIEIGPGATVSSVYQALATALQNFFSPVAPYYTLGQLQEKNVPLDIVFEGRPYTGQASHGFVLDEDLPDMPTGDEPIYVSAVIQQMQNVEGIKTVRKLKLLPISNAEPINEESNREWTLSLPEGYIPAFSLNGSSFRWFQNGQLLYADTSAYTGGLQLNFVHPGKVLYPGGSEDLDRAVPEGVKREGLGDYYSIQNDYPEVYGIGPGGLPSNASKLRQSQALQFKAYLLFFDQLLADYLAQLSNLRTIFSIGPGNGGTYFAGDVSSVPDLDPLLRFPPGGSEAAGVALAHPVDAIAWAAATANGVLSCDDWSNLTDFTFPSALERNIAVEEATVAFAYGLAQVGYLAREDKRWVYFITGIRPDLVLVSRKDFNDASGAASEATTVLFIAAAKENYGLATLATGNEGAPAYGFSILQTAASYSHYLQLLLEDPDRYIQRRTAFLQHLLARFTESFADYAMLSAGFVDQQEIQNNQVGLMERFLGNYPLLSAGRGQAFDKLQPAWNNENVAVPEKRFKAFCGIPDWRRHYLCPFEVHKYEDRFNIRVSPGGEELLSCPDPLRMEETMPAVVSLVHQLGNAGNYRAVPKGERGRYCLELSFYQRLYARTVADWPSEGEALAAAAHLLNLWKTTSAEEDCRISAYEYRPELLDHRDRVVRISINRFSEEQAALASARKMVKRINDPELWVFGEDGDTPIGRLHPNRAPGNGDQYLDVDGFRIYVQQDILDKPDRYSYEAFDEHNTFQFRSVEDFATEKEANEACLQLLHLLAEPEHYRVVKDPYREVYVVVVRAEGLDLAVSNRAFAGEEQARGMIHQVTHMVRPRLYQLRLASHPARWRFRFRPGLPQHETFVFESVEEYTTIEAALEMAALLYQSAPEWRIGEDQEGWLLEGGEPEGVRVICRMIWASGSGDQRELEHLVRTKKDIHALQAGVSEVLERQIQLDEPSKRGNYVYRLVDKDHPKAFHHCVHQRGEAEELRDWLILKGRKGYLYPEICLGGDNVYLREGDSSRAGLYYYCIRCRNDYFTRRGVHSREGELVLFESIAGFTSESEAQSTFQQEYLDILHSARDADNYGYRKPISLRDPDEEPADLDILASKVFVPRATQDAFAYASRDVVQELVEASRAYPIRQGAALAPEYYFVLVNEDSGETDWKGVERYPSPGEAHMALDYFRMLLYYPGNYFIDFESSEHCYRVGIREVLAESTHTFPDAETAWGPRGVERLICIAQSAGGWHPDMRKDCSFSYFLACRNRRAIHPCQYETMAQRDEALSKLFRAAADLSGVGWVTGPAGEGPAEEGAVGPAGEGVSESGAVAIGLTNTWTGRPLANIPLEEGKQSDEDVLNRILDMVDAVWAGGPYGEDMDGIYLTAGEPAFLVRPAAGYSSVKEWAKDLLNFAAYFPVTRTTRLQGGSVHHRYGLEIKMPGFADLPAPLSPDGCGCPGPAGDDPTCYAAWISEVDFGSGSEAWDAFLALLPLLNERENYRPVSADDCGLYGIELHESHSIVARNPQYYGYPALAMAALNRAKALVDTEGLDIVEHILLRDIPNCPDAEPCSAVWDAESPVDADGGPVLLFRPGADPYSFIMTAVLPAWPRRFRRPESRAMLERILQRETPSHILLRILWLTPWDMCRVEAALKEWLESQPKESAVLNELLFLHRPACLGACEECGEEETRVRDEATGEAWLSQINHLYCWEDNPCSKQEMLREAEPMREIGVEEPVLAMKPMEVVEPGGEEVVRDERQIRRLVMARLSRYQQRVEEWKSLNQEEELAGKVDAFLKDPQPSARRFEILVEEILVKKMAGRGKGKGKGKKGEGKATGLPEEQLSAMAGILSAFYLDKISMEEERGEKWEHFRKLARRHPLLIANPEQFLREWRIEELRFLVPGFDEQALRDLIRGK